MKPDILRFNKDRFRQNLIIDRDNGVMLSQLLRVCPQEELGKVLTKINNDGHNKGEILDSLSAFLPAQGINFSKLIIYERAVNLVYIDKLSRTIINHDKKSDKKLTEMTLSKQHLDLLMTLISQLGQPLRAEEVLEKIASYNGDFISTHKSENIRGRTAISYLRERLNQFNPGMSQLIKSRRSVGYSFNLEYSGLLGKSKV